MRARRAVPRRGDRGLEEDGRERQDWHRSSYDGHASQRRPSMGGLDHPCSLGDGGNKRTLYTGAAENLQQVSWLTATGSRVYVRDMRSNRSIQYTVAAPWGYRWTFSETLDDVAPEDWGGVAVTD